LTKENSLIEIFIKIFDIKRGNICVFLRHNFFEKRRGKRGFQGGIHFLYNLGFNILPISPFSL